MKSASALGAIAGLDVSQGLVYLGGDMESYFMILGVIVETVPDNIKKIMEFKENGDIQSFIIEVHGLKSVFKNVGAEDLSDMSRRLELAARGDDMDFVYSNVDGFIRDVNAFVNELSMALI